MAPSWRELASRCADALRGTDKDGQPRPSRVPTPDDAEEAAHDPAADRFVYSPASLPERLLVGFRLKNKLSASTLVRVPYRRWVKWLLVAVLVLLAAFFTPQLLPRWLGFEWSTPRDLCRDRDAKLRNLRFQIANLTRLPALRQHVARQRFEHACMDRAAARFYRRALRRFQWPDECTSARASASLREDVCVGPLSRSSCDGVRGIRRLLGGVAGVCRSVSVPKKCVPALDETRAQQLLELQREQAALELDDAASETQPIVQTANERATQLVERLLLQVDIASDLYIAYSIVALVIGMPLVVYKREKGSRILGATFGLRKVTFVIVVVMFLSIYDSVLLIARETDFSLLFANFRNDPCYVDAEFSRARVELIVQACNNVTGLGVAASGTVADMDETYFTVRRFGVCQDEGRPAATHPSERAMDAVRRRYRDGDREFPGVCNATMLDERTSTAASDPEVSAVKAVLGSGVVAQLFVKVIVASWVVHVAGFLEPMVLHGGKVEIWDAAGAAKRAGEDEGPLNAWEMRSAVGFARDKHLLALVVTSALMVVEAVLVVYSIVVTKSGRRDLAGGSAPPELPTNFQCPF